MRKYNPVPLVALLLAFLLAVGCNKGSDRSSALRTAAARTLSSFDPPTAGEGVMPAKTIKFEQADLAQVLNFYADISGRSIIRGTAVPDVKITFSNQTPMTPVEVLQALDTALAGQGIAMIFLGTQYVKVVPAKEATLEAGPIVELKPDQLPDSSSFLIYIVKLKNIQPVNAAPSLAPFSKLPNSIVAINAGNGSRPPSGSALANLPGIIGVKSHGILILRDYSSNVRRMLQVLEKIDQ
jgi:type II secretory pathway component GspD/PulD (secretin)